MSPRTPEQFEDMREEKKEIILKTALKLFADKGYHATSISAIAKEAGISKGLMYNYFESKESLLIKLFEDYIDMLGVFLNPNHDNEISNEEMESFLHSLTESMRNQNELWRLYFQLSLQKPVLDIIIANLSTGEAMTKQTMLLTKYFYERFENPMHEIIFFSSLIKGFCLQYVYAPEMFPEQELNAFLNRLKKMVIVEKVQTIDIETLKPYIDASSLM